MGPIVLAGLLMLPTHGVATNLRHADALTRYGVGLLRVRAGRPVGALREFEVAARSGAAPTQAELAKLYFELGRPAAATRLAQAAVVADPGDFATGQLLARLRLEAGRPADAVAALRRASQSPRLADADRKAALFRDLTAAAAAAQDWPALEVAARGLLALDSAGPESLQAYESLGRSFENRRQFAEATTAYKQASGRTPSPRLAWLLSGVLLAEGRNAEALIELEKVLRARPTGAEPYDRLLELLRRLKRTERAAPTLDTLAEQNPANLLVPWVAAEALAATDGVGAWTRFRALANSSAAPGGAARLVRFALSTGRESELLDLVDTVARAASQGRADDAVGPTRDAGGRAAVERFRALAGAVKADADAVKLLAPALDGGRGSAWHRETRDLLSLVAERAGRADALAQILSDGAGGNPTTLVNALFRQRKWAEAVQLCDELEANPPRRGPLPAVYSYLRATAYHELGRTDVAIQSLDTAARAGLDSVAVNLRKATILGDVGRPADAVTLCERVLSGELRPEQQLEARMGLAAALAKAGKYQQSDAQYDLARDLDPDSALVWNNYGYNLADQGRRLADAERMLRHAVELSRDERARLGSADTARGTYLDSLAWALFRRDKLVESRDLFEQAVGTVDGASDGVVWDHLGDVYARLGDAVKARTAWTRAVELYTNTHQGREGDRRAEAQRKLGR